MRKTDSRLSKGEDVVVCLPGARIEHVTERVEKIMGRGNDVLTSSKRLTQYGEGGYITTHCVVIVICRPIINGGRYTGLA